MPPRSGFTARRSAAFSINNYSLMIGPISYIGGKNRLARKIIPLFPAHTTYVEAFAGGAQVFFHKQPSTVEVLNDLDGEVINFLRVCQWHHEELIRTLRYHVPSRQWFDLHVRTDPALITDIQRAARFLYVQKNAFGGLVRKQHYHFGVVQRPNFTPERTAHIIAKAHERLQRVQLESLPYEQVLARYDRSSTLFYLDPPYWGPQLYKFNFTDDDFAAMAARLSALQGRFILSLNDCPKARATFGSFHMQAIELTYTAQRRAGRRYGELLISNFPVETGAGEPEH
jgi:DNA adenine methylase